MESTQHVANKGNSERGLASGDLREQVSTIANQVGSTIADTAEGAKSEVSRIAAQQKAVGADQLGGVAHAVHRAAEDLELEMPTAARYAHEGAAKLEQMATALRQKSFQELMDDASKFARAQPAAAFGASVLVGLALARFLKSSRDDGRS
jgi:hypothetical protein